MFYTQLVLLVRRLYQDCRLVHADLSEYNILVHQARPWSPTRVSLLTFASSLQRFCFAAQSAFVSQLLVIKLRRSDDGTRTTGDACRRASGTCVPWRLLGRPPYAHLAGRCEQC